MDTLLIWNDEEGNLGRISLYSGVGGGGELRGLHSDGFLLQERVISSLYPKIKDINTFELQSDLCHPVSHEVMIATSQHQHTLDEASERPKLKLLPRTKQTVMGESVPIEYVAIFLALVFPGALVAFNNDLLQALSNFASLRIYCAGIWHNAAFCAVCGLALHLLPLTLHPLYIHGENAMVLGISPSSPLSAYLSRGDVILSVDGENIHSPLELKEKLVQRNGRDGKGYCVTNALLEESKSLSAPDGNFSCSDGHAAFSGLSCVNSSSSFEISYKEHGGHIKENKYCISPEKVVKLSKCGEGWGVTGSLKKLCSCSENESCMTPLLNPGISWLEISYAKPYSSDCFQQRRNTSLVDSDPVYGSNPCGVGTFVYVGDKLRLAHSMWLSSYRPRWMYLCWSMDIPATLENILLCAYRVSAALVALNSLPVFFLDGEYILDTALHYINWLNPRKRRRAVKVLLIVGTILSVIAFSRLIYFTCHSVSYSA